MCSPAHRKLIEKAVAVDTRKLSSNEAFTASVSENGAESGVEPGDQPPRRRELSLKDFANQRREYLLNHAAVKEAMRD